MSLRGIGLMDYKNWYALSINMNKEKATKAELLARKAVFQDNNLEDVEYLQRKEIVSRQRWQA
jgi:hypothetical protein